MEIMVGISGVNASHAQNSRCLFNDSRNLNGGPFHDFLSPSHSYAEIVVIPFNLALRGPSLHT